MHVCEPCARLLPPWPASLALQQPACLLLRSRALHAPGGAVAPKHPCLLFLAACSLLRPVQAGYGADRHLPVQRQQWCVLGADACSAAAGWYPPSWVWEQPPPCLGACPHVGPTHLPAHLPTHTTSPHPCPSPLPCSRLPHGSAGACRQYRPQVRRRCICPLLAAHLPLVAPHLLMCRCWKPA